MKLTKESSTQKIISLIILWGLFLEYAFKFLAEFYIEGASAFWILLYKFAIYGLVLLVVFPKNNLVRYNKILYLFIVCYVFVAIFTGKNIVPVFIAALLIKYSFDIFCCREKEIGKILIVIFFVNAVLVLFQFIGIDEIFYAHQAYSYHPNSEYSFLQSADILILQQWRPSGLFPSTIYLTLFTVIFYSYIALTSVKINKVVYIASGFVFPFFGSTSALFLVCLAFFFYFLNRKMLYFAVGGLFSGVFLYFAFPASFQLNYGNGHLLASFASRFDVMQGNSFFMTHWVIGLILLFGLFLYLFYKLFSKSLLVNYKKTYYNLSVLFLLVVPQIIHSNIADSRYGLLCGMLLVYYCRHNFTQYSPSRITQI